jgi:hypothetical protein
MPMTMMALSRLPDDDEPCEVNRLMMTSSVQSGAVQLPEMADTEHFQFSDRGFEPIVVESMEIRFARTPAEILASQRLRYEVFYEEMATPIRQMAELRRDYHVMTAIAIICWCLTAAGQRARRWWYYRLITRDMSLSRWYFTQPVNMISARSRLPWRAVRVLPILRDAQLSDVSRHATAVARDCRLYLYPPGGNDVRLRQLSWPGCAGIAGAVEFSVSPPFGTYLAVGGMLARTLCRYESVARRTGAHQIGAKQSAPLIKGYLCLGAWVGDMPISIGNGTPSIFILVKTDTEYMEHYGLSGWVMTPC